MEKDLNQSNVYTNAGNLFFSMGELEKCIEASKIALECDKSAQSSINDLERRNTIAGLLSDWDLVEIIGNSESRAPLSQIKVLSFREKDEWILETKYNIGKKLVE